MLRVVLVLPAAVLLTGLLALALSVLAFARLPGRGAVSIAYSRTMCALIGVRIRVRGTPPKPGHPVLIVANHASWLDILVLTAVAPVIFVAKREVARWPLIGWVARARGTVFVDRERRTQAAAANAEIARHLAEGQSIVLFAEGTSNDGNRVLPFRSALVGAVRAALAEAGKPVAVQPLSVAYIGLHGLPMGRQHRPLVAWTGDRDLASHMVSLVRRGGVDATVSWGEPIAPYQGDRKALVRAAERQVRALTAAALRGRDVASPAPRFPAPAHPVAQDSSSPRQVPISRQIPHNR